jgi:alkylhydroperoxidase/carboxymuconolactone decarboxylase family protein YurZ
MTTSAQVAEVARELYRAPLSDFTAARDDAVKAAREVDTELADALKRLPKPSVAAWLVDLLGEGGPALLEELADIGEQLRDGALTDRTARRGLDARRRTLMSEAVQVATGRGRVLGQRIGAVALRELDATLRAVVSDESAAVAARSGLLVRPLVATGLEPLDVRESVAVPDALELPDVTTSGTSDVDDDRAERAALRRRAAALRELAAAERDLAGRRTSFDETALRLAQAQRDVEDLTERLAHASAELETAVGAHETADAALTEAEVRHEQARLGLDPDDEGAT